MLSLRFGSGPLFLLMLFFGVQTAAAEPALWRVKQGEATVHMLGTIHLLKDNTPWYGPGLKSLVRRSDSLTVEIATDQVDPMSIQQLMTELGFYPPGQSLADDLAEELHTRVMAAAQKAGLPTQSVERMRPWLVAVTLTSTLAARAGYLPQYGVEATLLSEMRAADTPVHELESMREQLQIFSGLPKEAQIAWLRDGLDELETLEVYVDRLKTAWLEGDLETIDRMLTEGLEASPELAEALLYERNRNWVSHVETLLGEPGSHLIAVGAGHLVGENSLVDLLRARGYSVERLPAEETAQQD